MQLNFQRANGASLKFVEQPWDHPWPWLFQVKNHVQRFGKTIMEMTPNFPSWKNGIPSWMQLISNQPNQKPATLTEPVQLWMWKLFKECAPSGMSDADIKKCWANAFMSSKMATNGTGWDKVDEETGEPFYKDVIMGTGDGKEGFKLQYGICHGATVLVLRPPFWKANVWQAELQAMNVDDPRILTKSYAENRHLIYAGVNWHRYPLPYGKADPFPGFESNDGIIHDVPFPLLVDGSDKAYIEWDWLDPYGRYETEIRSPYWRT